MRSVLSVNVGAAAVVREGRRAQRDRQGAGRRHRRRRPGPQAARARTAWASPGVAGDFVGNGRHHGGVGAGGLRVRPRGARPLGARARAPICPRASSARTSPPPGIDVDAAEQGDTWRVGGAVLRVSGPRVPCATFAAADGGAGWVRRFAERGRGGCYLAVVQPGRIRPGDADQRRAVRVRAWRSRCCSPAGWATSTRPATRWPTTTLDDESRAPLHPAGGPADVGRQVPRSSGRDGRSNRRTTDQVVPNYLGSVAPGEVSRGRVSSGCASRTARRRRAGPPRRAPGAR